MFEVGEAGSYYGEWWKEEFEWGEVTKSRSLKIAGVSLFFSTLEGVSVWHFRVGQDLRICFLLLYYTTRVAVGWRAVEEGGREKRHHKLVSV